jgi:outer membrane protein TolC
LPIATYLRWTARLLLFTATLHAQSLRETIDKAVANYPSVRVSDEQVRAAAAGIAVARTAYLPRADFYSQVNRATRNNVFGLLLPQSTLPNISGPPNPENSMTNVWGTAVGFLVAWEPFDFGLRQANVDVAEAARQRAQAAVARTKFEVAALTADAYLTALAAEQTLKAADARLARARAVAPIVEALAKAELRPGADISRSRAEVSEAEIQIVQAQNAIDIAKNTLKQLTGTDVQPVAGTLLELPPAPDTAAAVANSPYVREQQSAMAEVEAQRKAIDRSVYPRFNLLASSYARGTGANPDGTTLGGVNGLGPNIHNWAIGFAVTFPSLEFLNARPRREAAEARQNAEKARYDQIVLDLQTRVNAAQLQLTAARRIADLLPRQLEAARAAEQQALARYKAGLGTLVEVADAQRLLTQAEIDHSLARLAVWRSTLQVATAGGDLAPFLDQVK